MYYILNLEYQLQLQCQFYPLVNSQIVLVYYYTTKSSAMQCASKIMKKVEKAPFMLMERSQQKISLPSKSLVRQLFLYTSYNSNTPILLYMWDMIMQYSSEQYSLKYYTKFCGQNGQNCPDCPIAQYPFVKLQGCVLFKVGKIPS